MSGIKVIKAKRLIDGTGNPIQENIVIVVQKNIIEQIIPEQDYIIPEDAIVYDLTDKTVMPGLIDAHMHFFSVPSHELHKLVSESDVNRVLRGAGEAEKMLQAGITAARCLGSTISPALRKAINEGHIRGPRLVVAGEFVISSGGTWYEIMQDVEGADGPEEIRKKVRERIMQGANVIKVGLSKGKLDDLNRSWGDEPYQTLTAYSLDEVKALTDEAHANHLKVSAHCIGDAAVNLAIDGNVDVIEHGYAITEETRKRLVEKQIPVVTTISQLYFHEKAAEAFHYPEWEMRIYQTHKKAMKKDFNEGLKAGVKFVIGTDLIGYPTHPQDQAAKEFELAVEWGMDPEAAIVAGTKRGAEVLGLEKEIGTIEVGKKADLIAFDGNPIEDIKVLQKVDFVMKDGQLIKSEFKKGKR
ncbi:amidohydrolase family protein [Bacillus sp. FJAT-49711]|uniref:amidohydrolase family protein n=1 Tax=Bacillus sp. FJAT-49711 TaxID=2833585 RepID=UPI001BC91046|nr:amidohydrolase family protein [Bacillus sp. FJAT-49711]MBS4219001.1 amidohydrolase family protein [Bacillus sp. FJAT-49711]